MKIKGKWTLDNFGEKIEVNSVEIELSVEDLAKQLTKHDIDMLHLCKIEDKVNKAIRGKPTEPEKCEHEWVYTSPPHNNQKCLLCGIKRIEPSKRIEELHIKYINSPKSHEIVDKLNELIRAWNEEGK